MTDKEDAAELLPLTSGEQYSADGLSMGGAAAGAGTEDDVEVKRAALFAACKSGDEDAFNKIYKAFQPKEIDVLWDNEGWGPLHYVAMKGHLRLAKLLLDYGCDPNALDKFKNIALYRAVGFGHEDMVYYLVKRGANPMHINGNKDNMLHNSGWAGHVNITKFFLDKGLSPLDKDVHNHAALWDMVKMIPNVTAEYFDTKVRVITSHLLEHHVEYNFDGIDDQVEDFDELTPLELITSNSIKELVSHPLIKKLLEWKWKVFAYRHFIQQAMIYIFMLALFSYVCISVVENNDIFYIYNKPRDYVRGAFESILFFFAVYELIVAYFEFPNYGYEIIHTPASRLIRPLMLLLFKRTVDPARTKAIAVLVPRYFMSSTNYFKLATYVTMLVEAGIRAANISSYEKTERPVVPNVFELNLLAVISIMFYLRFLSLAALIPFLGPLLVAVYRMVRDTIQFMVLYFVFFFGFSIAFYLLLGKIAIDYTNYGVTLMTTFRGLTGDFDWTILFNEFNGLAYVVWVIYLLVANIVLLTLLVAMMSNSYVLSRSPKASANTEGNSFDLVKYDAAKEFLFVRARYILYVQKVLGKKRVVQLLAADLKKRAQDAQSKLVGHNNTPDAEFIKTNHYSEWQPKQDKENEDEVNLQVLRNELMKEMHENASKTEELFITVLTRLDELEAAMSGTRSNRQTRTRNDIRQVIRQSALIQQAFEDEEQAPRSSTTTST